MDWIFDNKPPQGTPLKHNPSLVGYWPMWEGSGDKVYDLSGNGHTGTLTGMDPKTDWVPGKFGDALDFDGTNEGITIFNFPLTRPLTVVAWIYAHDNTWKEILGIFNVDNSHYAKFAFAGATFGWVTKDDVEAFSVSTPSPAANTWICAVGTLEASGQLTLFIDGIQKSTTRWGRNPILDRIKIADIPGYGDYDGLISHYYIYNRALSAQEIRQLFIAPFGHFQYPSVARHFIPAVGAIAPTSVLYGPLAGPLAGPV